MTPIWRLGGHLGSSVSALVDGQLDDETAERAWQHILQCPSCRDLVEHEGWVKRQLAQIAGGPAPDEPSDRLVGSLLGLDPATLEASSAWAETDRVEERARARRRAGIALVGAGSVSAAVFGLSTLGATPMGIGGSAGSPASSVGGANTSGNATPAFVAPAASVHGRLSGWTLGSGGGGVAHARPVGSRR
jgi:anti-sigma factor RsiW